METKVEIDPSSKLVDEIFEQLLSVYTIEELMDLVARNRDKNVYVYVKRGKPRSAKIVVDTNGKHAYRCDDVLCIPVPKKFALLEPDATYFEITLKANICLALKGAAEKELHQ